MRKVYSMLLALGVAAASLTSCSKSTYSFNSAPAYLGSQPVAVAKAAPVAAPAPAATPVTAATKPEPVLAATKPAPVAKAAPAKAAPVVAATVEVAPVAVAPAEALATVTTVAKPTLLQRLALKSVVKQVTKLQQKQATAGTERTQGKVGRALLIALAGLLLYIIGIIIAGGSAFSGNGGGATIGIILAYIGLIAFIAGIVLGVIALVSGS